MLNPMTGEEKRLPRVVRAADNYSVPIIFGGQYHWDVVDTHDPKNVIASVSFSATDPKHPEYREYMVRVKTNAEELAEIINSGLEFNRDKHRAEFWNNLNERNKQIVRVAFGIIRGRSANLQGFTEEEQKRMWEVHDLLKSAIGHLDSEERSTDLATS